MTSAAAIAHGLNAKRSGSSWIARCPAHKDRTPSFSISERDGVVLVHCFSGCPQEAVIAALTSMGLWDDTEVRPFRQAPSYAPKRVEDREGYRRALAIWDGAQPIKGTLAEAYLRARCIRGLISDQLKYAPALWHSNAKAHYPALVARLSDAAGFIGIQRTYLDPSAPKKAPVARHWQKKCLGAMGVSAVRLSNPGIILGLAEGIESALSASNLYSLPVWATLGTARLAKIEIPRSVHNIHIFADPKPQEREAAFKAAETWESRGMECEVIFPKSHFESDAEHDFNDISREGVRLA